MAGIKFDFTGDNKNLLNSAKQAQTGVVNAINSIERAGKGIESTFSSIKNSVLGGFTDIAKGMAGLTALMQGGNFIKELIADAGKFKVAMKEVSTLSEDVATNLQKYVDQVADMTTQIPIGATEAAKALYQIESAGHHGADGLNVLRESAKGAIGGVTDTATTADAITTILNAYNMEASEAQHVSDLLFTTVRLGKTNMSQLGTTIAQVAPVAASFGVSIEDVLAAIASLTKQGTKTSVAVRQVRDAITATTKSMGDGAFQGRSFLDAMDEVAQKAQGSNNALRQDLGTLQALNAVLSLTGKNSQAARQDVADMQNSAGAAEAAYEKMASTAGTQVTLLRNNIFKAILPLADEMRDMSSDIARYMNEAFDSGAMDKALVSLEAFIAAYATYRGMLAASTAWNSAALGGTYKAQIAELQKLIPLKELDGQADLQAAVAKGTLTTEQAKLVASLRAETEARYEEVVAAETEARANLKALTAAEASATANVTAAEEMVASAQARLVAATQSGVATEIETAKEELNTAEMLRNDAVRKKTIITRQMEGAQTMVSVTSKNAETAATLMNTTQQGVNATATGILATAKLHLAAAIDAVNASFLASPLFWIAAAIAGVTFAVYKLVTAETANEEAIRKANEAMDEQKKKLDERKSTIEGLLRTISDPNATDYQKIKAYDALKQVASDLTDAYSREALATMEAAKAQKILNESMDEAEYNGLVEEVKKAEKAYKDALAAREAAKTSSEYGYYDPDADYSGRELAKAKKQLEVARQHLEDAERIREEARKAADDAATPIEIRIEAAKENEAEQKRIFDFYDDVMSRVDDIQSSHNKLNFDEAQSKLDDYISEVEAELADLHTKAEQNPIDEKIRLEEEEKTNLLNNLVLWKQQMAAGGYTTIPLMFKSDWGSAQAALNAATGFYQNLITQTTAGGTQSMADLYEAAKTDYETALKEWKRVSNKKNAPFITQEEYNKAKTNLATAKSSFEAVGGDPDGKLAEESKRKAEEQAKETAARHQKQLEEEWKYQDELKRIKEQGADAAADAEIAAEKDAAVRERLERKTQHDRKIKELEGQEADIYKAIYEQRKKAYEAANKGKYTDTKQGALGWGKEAMKGTFTKEEQEYFDARYAIIKAWIDKENAEWERGEEERKKSHVQSLREYLREYGNELEQELAITQDYQEQIAKARAEGDEGKAMLLEKKMQEALSDMKLENLKKSSEYVRAFEDLSSASSDTLKSLIAKFEAAKESAAKNLTPDQLREYTSTLQQMYDELNERNPFDTLAQSIRELAEAQKEVKSAQDIYDRVKAGETVINEKTGQTYTEEEATRRLTEAKDNEARVYTKLTKATDACASRLNSFAGTLNNLGEMVGGKLGKSLGALGGVLGSVGGAFENIKSINVNATGLEKTMGQVSAVAGTVSAMVEMNRQLDSILPSTESLYEHYARKQAKINEQRQRVIDLEIEMLKKRMDAESWISKTQLQDLSEKAQLNAEYLKAYGALMAAPQEVYKEARSGLSKWAPAIVGAIVGIIAGAITFGAGSGAGAALGAAIGSAIGGTAIGAALGSTVIAAIGTIIMSGIGAAFGNAVRAGIDGIIYQSGQTSAINNLRVQTQHKSFWRGEKTKSLEDYVQNVLGLGSLFDEVKGGTDKVKIINTEIAQSILDSNIRLVGETRETLEKAIEYSEKIKEFLEDVREYIKDAFGPLTDNLVDSLFDWMDEGKDVMDSFRDYAGKTFRDIANDAMKTMANKLIFQGFQEQLEDLVIAYSTNQLEGIGGLSNEENFMLGVSTLSGDMQKKIQEYLPTLKNALSMINTAFQNVNINIADTSDAISETISSMTETFKEALADMEDDADDFGKKIAKIMYDALLERFMLNSKITLTIDGKEKTFENLDTYLDDWQSRSDEIVKALTPEEYDTQKTGFENQIKSAEDSLHSYVAYYDSQIKHFKEKRAELNRFNYLMSKSEAEMSEYELERYREMLGYDEQIAYYEGLKAKKTEETNKRITELRNKIKELEESEVLTDEERATAIAEHNKELQEQLYILKQVAKTYADMSGFGIEVQIDASPFANLADDILSFVNDSTKTIEDWKKDIVKMMTEDLVKELVLTDDFKNRVRDLQEMYIYAMTGDMDKLSGFKELFDENGTFLFLDEDGKVKTEALLKWIADQIAGMATTAKTTSDSINESMGVVGATAESSFGDMHDSFMDAIMDMEDGAENLSKKLRETLVRDLLDKKVFGVEFTADVVGIDGKTVERTFSNFEQYQEDWTRRYLAALETGDKALIELLVKELEEREAAMAKSAEDTVKMLQEATKDTTFTDMESNFVSALMDMEGDVKDFANDIKKTIVQKLVEAFLVSEKIKPLLDDLQKTFNHAMGLTFEGMTTEEATKERAKVIAEGYTDENGERHQGVDDITGVLEPIKLVVNELLTAMGYVAKEGETLFSNLGDTILESLLDVGSGVEGFMDSITQTITEDLVKSYMATDEFQDGLKTVKDDLEAAAKALADAKTPEEIAAAEEQLKNAKKAAEDFYNEAVGGTKRFTDALKKIENDTTFKDMTGNWVSNLMDFNATAEDWAEEIGQTMAQKIIEQMIVPTMIQPLLDNIQKAFNDAMATNTTSDADGNAVYNWKGVLNDEGLKASITALQDAYPELKDVVQQILSLSGVKPDFSNSLDSLGDTLLDRLLSLDDDVEDIGKQIGQTLIREMLEQMLSTGQYADRIAAIKKMWQAILTGEDTEHTIDDVLKDIEQLENDITNPENSDFSSLIAKYKSLADVAKEGFSDLRGAFLSSLIDMNGDAETFGKSIGRTMLEQMLDAYVERTYKQQIADINKEWAEALQSGNTAAIERIKQKVQELYSTISTDVEVSNIADAIKELDKQLDTTFSDMADSWTSTLMDMEATAEDWAQSVGKMIAEKIIKSMVIPTMIQPILDTMQKAWNAAAEQEGATYQTMLDAMMPYVGQLVGAYEELRPIADYILNSLGVYKETVEEVAEEVEYHLQDLKSNFVSSLMDMEQSAEDWSESISKIMAEAFIKDFVLGDAFDAQMKDWQAHYESILNSGLSEEDRLKQMKLLRDAIVSAKEGYVEQAMAIQELMGLNAASSNQTATANIADKITYEQADQLLGINMAQEMTLEQILYTLRGGIGVTGVGLGLASSSNSETTRQIESTLNSMGSLTSSDSETIREIRGLIIIGNSYLYDIKTSNEQMLRQFGERLESIDGKIGQIF